MDNMNVRPHRGLVEIIDEVMVSGAEKDEQLEIARRLEAYHKLDPRAGVENVAVFETEAELRDEVIKTCLFEFGVEDDGSLRGLEFRHRSEDGEVQLTGSGRTREAPEPKFPPFTRVVVQHSKGTA
jgi:hypothetical protein